MDTNGGPQYIHFQTSETLEEGKLFLFWKSSLSNVRDMQTSYVDKVSNKYHHVLVRKMKLKPLTFGCQSTENMEQQVER